MHHESISFERPLKTISVYVLAVYHHHYSIIYDYRPYYYQLDYLSDIRNEKTQSVPLQGVSRVNGQSHSQFATQHNQTAATAKAQQLIINYFEGITTMYHCTISANDIRRKFFSYYKIYTSTTSTDSKNQNDICVASP